MDDQPFASYLTPGDISRELGITPATVSRLMHSGRLPSVSLNRTRRVIERAVFDQWKADYKARRGPKAWPEVKI